MLTPAGFELVELGRNVSDKEMDDLVEISRTSLVDQDMFQLRIQGLPDQQKDAWIRRFWLQTPLSNRRYESFAIRDLSSGALVAWTALQYPATQTEAEKHLSAQMRIDLTSALEPAGQAFVKMFDNQTKEVCARYGYDPEKDFHKRNTLIHAAYQKCGLGTWLVEHCNNIADRAQCRTFVLASPKAWKMFENTGFQFLEQISYESGRYGGRESITNLRYFKRDPPLAL